MGQGYGLFFYISDGVVVWVNFFLFSDGRERERVRVRVRVCVCVCVTERER